MVARTESEVWTLGQDVFHAIVVAEAAVGIALRLEDPRIETEHEADERLVVFHAVLLADAAAAIALKRKERTKHPLLLQHRSRFSPAA